MKKIIVDSPKYGRKEILVDDEMYDYVKHWKWCISWSKDAKTFYAIRKHYGENGFSKSIKLHRFIFGLTNRKIFVDHIDHNGLNCTLANMRLVTQAKNNINRRSIRKKTSRYKGVYWMKRNHKFSAEVQFEGKGHYLGLFDNELDAARAYDCKAKELHGDYACLNFPTEIK